MRKLMFAAAAMAAGLVMADAVESQNVVGYNVQNSGTSLYLTGGMCFVTSGSSSGTFRLGDLKLAGSTWGSDWLNFVNPTTSAVDPTKNVTYWSEAEAIADGGTADDAEWEDIDENCKDDVSIPMGTGFLCNFMSSAVQVVFPAVQP